MKCPKCGSEMQQWTNDPLVGTIGEWVCPVCHHSEPIFECGHEEKVGGEKCPKCGSEMRYFDRFAAWRHKEPVYGPGPDDYGRIRYYRCVKCGHESALWEEFPGGEKG